MSSRDAIGRFGLKARLIDGRAEIEEVGLLVGVPASAGEEIAVIVGGHTAQSRRAVFLVIMRHLADDALIACGIFRLLLYVDSASSR